MLYSTASSESSLSLLLGLLRGSPSTLPKTASPVPAQRLHLWVKTSLLYLEPGEFRAAYACKARRKVGQKRRRRLCQI